MKQITIREIAKICGVGVSTVSRAMNGHVDINEETKQKILNTIKEYNYVPNNSARNLKRSDSNTIAVLVKGIGNPFFADMIQVMEQQVKDEKYSFVLHQVEEDVDEVEEALRLEKEKRLKGIVFLGGMACHDGVKLEELSVPYVICTVNTTLPEQAKYAAVVSIDDERESYRMTDYLIRKGHRRIAILTGLAADVSIANLRLDGYKKALRDHQIPYDEKLVVHMSQDLQTFSMENGYAQTKKLLEDEVAFTCIYAISDTIAIGACRAVHDAGKKIPEDCAVAGFDGLDITKYYHPSVTTISQPRRMMAIETIRSLFGMIEGKQVEKKQIFEAELLERESTGV